jgi:transcriptional regulator with XRE-family HTH domain
MNDRIVEGVDRSTADAARNDGRGLQRAERGRSRATDGASLGQEIRAERLRQSLTLAQLAGLADLTVSAPSQIERGASDPSIASLRRIASGLRVPMYQLLGGGKSPDIVVRRDQRVKVRFPARKPQYELLGPSEASDFSVLALRLAPHSVTSDEGRAHPSEECAIVVRGRVTAEVGAGVYQLGVGDSIKIHRELPHRFANAHDDEAEMIIVVSPAVF